LSPTASSFAALPFHELVQQLAARTPTPGGGTGAALGGALGAALGCMAVRFSIGRKGQPVEHDAVLAKVEAGLLRIAGEFERLADEDAASFEAVRTARGLPKATPAEQTARLCREAMECLEGSLAALNTRLATDAGSGALLLRAGARCAAWNVLVNLVGDASPAAAARRGEVTKLLTRAAELEQRIVAWTDAALTPS